MGERKGQNHYYPPDFDPKKHGSLNGYHGTHALRERARKIDQGILVIRFEMPYKIWCDGCKNVVAMGVRYNAEKKKVGKYFTTAIFEFKMKCHLCDNYFVIRTDPKNHDYVIMSGAKRKEQRWDMAENEQIVTEEKSDIKRLNTDPMFKLEHEANDKSKLEKLMPTLVELEEAKLKWKDDYSVNTLLRNKFRIEKKIINLEKEKDKEFLDKWNLDIKLVKENENDVKLASLYKFYSIDNKNEVLDQEEKRKKIENESIFDRNNEIGENKSTVNTSVRSSRTASSSDSVKTVKIDNLRKKLTKSIQEKKLQSLLNSSDTVKVDTKSLYFNVKKSTDDGLASNKISSLITVNKNKNSVDTGNGKVTTMLVDYGNDDDSDE